MDQALDLIDATGRSPEPLNLSTLSKGMGRTFAKGENHPGEPFTRVQIWERPSGEVEVHFHVAANHCFTEEAARTRYGHLFANARGHRPWKGKEWTAQLDGYRLSLGIDDAGCVRRIGLKDGPAKSSAGPP